MSAYFIQHGYGKGSKLDLVHTRDSAQGVILSPGDEGRDAMRATIAGLGNLTPLLDPQTYVYSIPGGTARCHEDHGLAFDGLHWAADPRAISQIVSAVLQANAELGLDRIIAPSCLQHGFGDVWTPLALQLARATVGATDRDVLASLVIDETSLTNWRDVATWLDIATTLDVSGYYVVINRGPANYLAPWNPDALKNLLRVVYSLTELNRYDVVLGYSDFEGVLALAAGVSTHATGWFYSLRRFTDTKWQPSSGGRAASPRVTSEHLLTPIRAVGEADQIVQSGDQTVIGDANVRTRLSLDAGSWSLTDSWDQHLQAVGRASSTVAAIGTLAGRVGALDSLIQGALATLTQFRNAGYVLPAQYETRLDGFRVALEGFASAEGL